jgi:hypothetical protein
MTTNTPQTSAPPQADYATLIADALKDTIERYGTYVMHMQTETVVSAVLSALAPYLVPQAEAKEVMQNDRPMVDEFPSVGRSCASRDATSYVDDAIIPPGPAPDTPGRADEWQLVPKVPTPMMVAAGWAAHRDCPDSDIIEPIFEAMLTASPSPPAQSGDGRAPELLSHEERLIWLLGNLMDGVENYYGAENPKRLGHINCAAMRIIDEVIEPRVATLTKQLAEARHQTDIAQRGEQTWKSAHADASQVAELAEIRVNEAADRITALITTDIDLLRAIQSYHAALAWADKVIEPFADAADYAEDEHHKLAGSASRCALTIDHLRAARAFRDRNRTG